MTDSVLLEAARHRYWEAQALADSLWEQFQQAQARDDDKGLKETFFLLTHYYARTISILRTALEDARESLAVAAMRNLIVLDKIVGTMHRAAPDVLPLALPLTEGLHDIHLQSLILRALNNEPRPMSLAELIDRIKRFKLLGEVSGRECADAVHVLETSGFIERSDNLLRSRRGKKRNFDMGRAMMESILGSKLASRFAEQGYRGLHDVTQNRARFIRHFKKITNLSGTAAALFADVAIAFEDERRTVVPEWRHRDLIHSPIPRPYQIECFEKLRGERYAGLVLEAVTGSGKTLIALMCVQDWLGHLSLGESILVLAPTSNYQQQWMREACYSDRGLDLSPEYVFAGTPKELDRVLKLGREPPVMLISTYTALVRTFGATAQFDSTAFMKFLHNNGVKYVILDEVHKTVSDLGSHSAQLVRTLTGATASEDLQGVIGISGTATMYQQWFVQVGLRVAHVVPAGELIAAGFVAPFSEFGVPYAYSKREQAIRAVLEAYKGLIHRFLDLADHDTLRAEFAKVPIERRVAIAREIFRMWDDAVDAETALRKKLTAWESGGLIKASERRLVSILQIATQRSDESLIAASRLDEFYDALAELHSIRDTLAGLVSSDELRGLLAMPGFGRQIDVSFPSPAGGDDQSDREKTMIALASTIVGLYDRLTGLYRQMGEGRVAAIRAVSEGESHARRVTGIIIFEESRRLAWEQRGVRAAGFSGSAGTFAEFLGRERFTPMAALSTEIYLPWADNDPMPHRIADYIERRVMKEQVARAMEELLLAGLTFPDRIRHEFHETFSENLSQYITRLRGAEKESVRGFNLSVLRPVRKRFGHRQRGISVADAARLRARLSIRNPNLRALLLTFFDYAALTQRWRNPHLAELSRADGARFTYAVVEMPDGRQRQLMYDLVSQVIDDADLPVNVLIVTDWARTGWNVIAPNVLIDATATRDVTAWQQLRGRAMRALRTWDRDSHKLAAWLLGSPSTSGATPRAEGETIARDRLGKNDRQRLADMLEAEELAQYKRVGLRAFGKAKRTELATRLMLRRNKVTHIYELIRAGGSDPQIRLDRNKRTWVRKEHIAEKHEDELGVDLESGHVVAGEAHAPLLYETDPRSDEPESLRDHIEKKTAGWDKIIIEAWLASRYREQSVTR